MNYHIEIKDDYGKKKAFDIELDDEKMQEDGYGNGVEYIQATIESEAQYDGYTEE